MEFRNLSLANIDMSLSILLLFLELRLTKKGTDCEEVSDTMTTSSKNILKATKCESDFLRNSKSMFQHKVMI